MRCAVTLLILVTPALATAAEGPMNGGLDGLIREQAYEARRVGSANPDIHQNSDLRQIAAGDTLVLMDEDGPGIVTHFWNTVSSRDFFYARSLVLRIYYDGNERPSVMAPLGDFFSMGHGIDRDLDSQPVSVTSHGRSRVCYWRMPFRGHIKITVSNDSQEHAVDAFYYQIDWQKHDQLPDDIRYFHAHYRQEFPARPGNYVLLDTRGAGHYAGTVYSVHQMETGWFGEGDDFFYIDGAEMPQLRGTGTEDYFSDAWGFREFTRPYYGVPLYEGIYTGDRLTAYRWHIEDPVPFKKSLRVEMEHRGNVLDDGVSFPAGELGGFFERADWISSVAFWYQSPPVAVDDALPPPAKHIPPYRIINGADLTFRADPPGTALPVDNILVYLPKTPSASLEVDFELAQDGRYRIDGVFIESFFGGIYQPYLDGAKMGGPRNFAARAKYDPVWVSLDVHNLKAGKHTLRFEGTGQAAPELRGIGERLHSFALGALTLLRLDDMEGYHAVLNQELHKARAGAQNKLDTESAESLSDRRADTTT